MDTAAAQLTPEVVVARVRRDLDRDCADGRISPAPPPEAVEHAVRLAVADLWQSRVKVFVPLLALRTAREALQPSAALAAEAPAPSPDAPAAGAAPPTPARWAAWVLIGGVLAGDLVGRTAEAESHGAVLGGLAGFGLILVWCARR